MLHPAKVCHRGWKNLTCFSGFGEMISPDQLRTNSIPSPKKFHYESGSFFTALDAGTALVWRRYSRNSTEALKDQIPKVLLRVQD
jgi:hypothetical protein